MTRRISILLALFALALPATAGAAGPHPNGPIVFEGGTRPGENTGLWAWKADWKGLRHITKDPADREPQGSPNGRWIVFARRVETTPGGGVTSVDIFLARRDGSKVVQVTSGHFDRSPSFSRSGKRILFARAEPRSGRELAAEPASAEELTPEHVYSVRLDGTGLHQLTSGDFSDRNPVLSPNGKVIAFERCQLSMGCHVFTMRPDGSSVRDATPRLAAWKRNPRSTRPGAASSMCGATPAAPPPTSSRCARTARPCAG